MIGGVPASQQKLVAPLLIVLVVAVAVTVARVRSNVADSVQPQPGPAGRRAGAAAPAAEPAEQKGALLQQTASLRNPFDPSALGRKAAVTAADQGNPGPPARANQPAMLLPPATVAIAGGDGANPVSAADSRPADEPKQAADVQEQAVIALGAIVRSGDTAVAILSVGASEMRAVKLGDTVSAGYRLIAIGEGYVKLTGPDHRILRLSLPGSEMRSQHDSAPAVVMTGPQPPARSEGQETRIAVLKPETQDD